MNIVDTSGWLEFFAGTKHAGTFSGAIENTNDLIVPVITIYEVFKKLLSESDENAALTAVAHMKQGTVIDVDLSLAMQAAELSREYALPMVDSLILATAQKTNSTLWTMDKHFKGIQKVKYFRK